MSHSTFDAGNRAQLRQDAQQRLQEGIAPQNNGWGVSVEALTLLHRLASSPANAPDALKMLHELQVHQVELDLQHAQLESNERELASDLARYQTLYSSAPVAYLVLDPLGGIRECNLAGARLLGVSEDEANGRRLDGFLAADSRPLLAGLLDAVVNGAVGPCCTVQPARGETGSERWRITAGGAPAGDSVLLVLVESEGATDR